MYKERLGWNKIIWTNSNRGLPVGFLIAQNSPWYGTRREMERVKREKRVTSPLDQFSDLCVGEGSVVSDWLKSLVQTADWKRGPHDESCEVTSRVTLLRAICGWTAPLLFMLFFQGWKQRTRSQCKVQRCKIRARVPRMKWCAWEGFLRVTNNAHGSENTLYNITWHM